MSYILYTDFIAKFPKKTLKKKPKLNNIKITTNLNQKKFSNIFTSSFNSSSISSSLLIRFILFSSIFGQTPQIIKAKYSISNWNIRKGSYNGLLLTLRPSHPFFHQFFVSFYPLLLHHNIYFSFSNKSDPSTSNFGLSSLTIFSPLIPSSSSFEKYFNIIQNYIPYVGLRFHLSSSFSRNECTIKTAHNSSRVISSSSLYHNALIHLFILSFFKIPHITSK